MNSSTFTLDRLLARLDHTLLRPEADTTQLKHSPYERNRVGANIEHARNLLMTLERQAASIRVQSQRQQQQADLQRRRERIKILTARLREYGDAGEDWEQSQDDEDSDDSGEDILATYAPARKDASANAGLEAGTSTRQPQSTLEGSKEQQHSSELRARKPLHSGDNRSLASTSAREQLFAGAASAAPLDPSLTDVQRTETMMSHHRQEQENLTDGLLGLARALKASSQAFGASLETEKEVLKRAEGGLDKNAQGMEAAERRMSTLRKMSEGQGWWGRLKLYGFIGGLWLACFLLVFIGPKLRF